MSSAKRSLLKKTLEVGIPTFLSRMLGIVRETLQARVIGINVVSDAFVVAFKLPNSLRKIFAEGALTGAFVPTIVSLLKKDGKASVNDLMTVSFIVFEGLLLGLCTLIFFFPAATIKIMAPGFSSEHVAYAIPFLRILISFILFISSSALIACALQSVNHFLIPAFASVFLNIFFIGGLLACQWYGLPITYLCGFIVAGSIFAFATHLIVYFYYHFSFGSVNARAWANFRVLLKKFIPSMLGMSIVELNMILDSAVCSFLRAGSVTLINLSYRFMGIPLGVFSVAFSSILLPHFSKMTLYAPKRLNMYLLESIKFVFWITVPTALFMSVFSQQIFMIFAKSKFPLDRIPEAATIMVAFLAGLFFFSVNKILLNIFYAFHDTKAPTFTSIVATLINFVGSVTLVFVCPLICYEPLTNFFVNIGITSLTIGIAMVTTFSSIVQTILLLYFLRARYNFVLYWRFFFDFCARFVVQLTLVAGLFVGVYVAIVTGIQQWLPTYAEFLTVKIGLWLWLLPLAGIGFMVLYLTRKWVGLRIHFLD